jgi:hypothetical protein
LSEPVVLLVGLDPPEVAELKPRLPGPVVACETLPRVRITGGELLVEDRSRWDWWRPVSRVVFHAIFDIADDVPFASTLDLWGGPCLPSPGGMLLARPRVTNLAVARRASRYAGLARTYLPAGGSYTADRPTVAKWGEWHCGEGKELFTGERTFDGPTLLEPFAPGDAVRVQVIGGAAWQIRLGGDDWKKSLHHATAAVVPLHPALEADTRRMVAAFGLELGAADYILDDEGAAHLLEFNHIPNVTQFPEIRAAYLDFVAGWIASHPVPE